MFFPSEWKKVLSEVQSVFPGAVIAGGALRDFFLGRPIKDVDIFIPVTNTGDVENLIYNKFPLVTLHKAHAYEVKSIPKDVDRDLYAIFNLKTGYEYQYDLIVGSPSACDMNSFDINICQIKYDGINITVTPDFIDGAERKVIKVLNINRTDRNAKRVARLLEKYPEYKVEETNGTDIR